jgi:regulator of sirC expression with transglutaminase-like and TPR domain
VSEPRFAELAADPAAPPEELALAIACALRSPVDVAGARAELDRLGARLAEAVAGLAVTDAAAQAAACGRVLGGEEGLRGDTERYDDPRNSMLDLVLERRRGLPILLSVVYVAAGRRAGVPLAGVGLPGHYVVGHFGAARPVLLDPFGGGALVEPAVDPALVRPWRPQETAQRMLTNLVAALARRGHVAGAIQAAELRLLLPPGPAGHEELEAELRALRARLN